MNPVTPQNVQDDRVEALEAQLADLSGEVEEQLRHLDARMRRIESDTGRLPIALAGARREARPTCPARPLSGAIRPARSTPAGLAGSSASQARRSERSLGDIVGGRVLAWLGGAATLLGIVLFLALAISHGWIGETARVLLADAASLALMCAGVWLYERRGRTESAVVMVGTAIAGLFATVLVAAGVYGLMPGLLAVMLSIAVGALATALAVRWGRSAIAGIGLLGALLSRVLVGAPLTTTTLAILTAAAACAVWVVLRRRWGWLALCTVAICAPQWAAWVLRGQGAPLDAVVLGAYAGLGLLGAAGAARAAAKDGHARWAAATAAASACVLAVVGRVALGEEAGAAAGNLWLVALASAHVAAGSFVLRRGSVPPAFRQVLSAIGIALADAAFALSAHGVTLAIGWSASAVVFAWLARRDANERGEATMYQLGVGAQIALALVRALLDAPPGDLLAGHAQLLPLLSLAALAAACLACARLIDSERSRWASALDASALAAIAYLTASALDGPALVVAFAAQALALARLDARAHDGVTRCGALAFAAAAALHTLAFEAPPVALFTGEVQLADAGMALAALAFAAAQAGRLGAPGTRRRSWPLAGAAGTLVYLASLAIVGAFGPASSAAGETVLELGVRQQSQVALSAFWSLAGVAALIVGLRRGSSPVRSAGLALLLTAVAKVFLYDLSTLTSVYRVVSFIVLGLLLLLGAFAYQRMRPPAQGMADNVSRTTPQRSPGGPTK